MNLERIDKVAVWYRPHAERREKVGRLAVRRGQVSFEYEPAFVQGGLPLSPFKLPLTLGLVNGDPRLFGGLMGVFDDSLPDGWGRLLIDNRAEELGFTRGSLSPLDYLTLVGARSMGALVYEPEVAFDSPEVVRLRTVAKQVEAVLEESEEADLERLIALGGSPKGARPKILVQLTEKGEVRFGAREREAGCTAWLVKFRSKGDDAHSGELEHAYFLMADAAGLAVPRTQLLEQKYFAIERFDRPAPGRRIHMHSLGGLLGLPHGYPLLDYRDVLEVTSTLTRDAGAVEEMFRRACFNVLAHNRDDHSRNFTFLMSERGEWSLSPAYDLTWSPGPGGEHTTTVMGEGRSPGETQLLALGQHAGVKQAKHVVAEVKRAIMKFDEFADAARVPAKLRKKVAAELKRIR